jgi:hypothetical protein
LRQRHTIRSIPVHEVQFMYKDSIDRFWVYGLDHQVCCGLGNGGMERLEPSRLGLTFILPPRSTTPTKGLRARLPGKVSLRLSEIMFRYVKFVEYTLTAIVFLCIEAKGGGREQLDT